MKLQQNNKGVFLTLSMVVGFALLIIGIVLGFGLMQGSTDRVKANIELFLADNFNFLLVEKATEEDLRGAPIPRAVYDYTDELVATIFEDRYYQRKESIVLVEPFYAAMQDEDTYEDYSIILSYSELYAPYTGILVSIYHGGIDRVIPYLTPENTPKLRYKELCSLPSQSDSRETASILLRYLSGPEKDARYLPSEIISRGEVQTVFLDAREEGMSMVSRKQLQEIFKYEQDTGRSSTKLPVYIYDNTVCFLAADDEGISIREVGNVFQILPENGGGPLAWSVIDEFTQRRLAYEGEAIS